MKNGRPERGPPGVWKINENLELSAAISSNERLQYVGGKHKVREITYN